MADEKIVVVCKHPDCQNCEMLNMFEQSHICLKKDVSKGDVVTIEIKRNKDLT